MTAQPDGGDRFEAGHDNRGAFATGAGASARNVEAGGTYIENYNGAAPPPAILRSFIPEHHQDFVVNDHEYRIRTVDAVLLETRRYVETRKEANGTFTNQERLQLFFQKGTSTHLTCFGRMPTSLAP